MITVAVIGWKIVYNNAKKLANRSEIFQTINRTNQQIDAIIQDSVKYWSEDKQTKEYSKIKSIDFEKRVATIRSEINILESRGFHINNFSTTFFTFRRSLTLDVSYFDKMSSIQKSQRIESVYDDAINLKNAIGYKFVDWFKSI